MATLFFNVKTLEEKTLCDPHYMVMALWYWYKKITIPKRYATKYKPLKNISGFSYLLKPEAFFKDKTTDIIWKAQVIRLAGRRDYTLYKLYGFKFLDLSYFPDIDIKSIESNPLISITDNKIYFKYEE
jgi:hypothetical protein